MGVEMSKPGRQESSLFAIILIIGVLLILVAGWLLRPSTGQSVTVDTGPLASSNTAFGLELFAQLRGKKGNLVFSPHSVSICLAMTLAGARGNTEQQMVNACHFGTNQIHATFGQLQKEMRAAPKGTELNIANGLWVQSGHPLILDFLSLVQEYGASVNQVDFHRASTIANDINAWASNETKGKLTNVVPPGILHELSRLVLVNIIYFKGTWETRFNPSQTMEWDFHLDQNQTVKCQMMHCTGKFRSGRFYPDCEVVELPYKGDAFSMIIFLPTDWEGLEGLEGMLTNQKISFWLNSLREPSEAMHMRLPKFKFEAGFELNKSLAAMGVTDAFNTNADFSGIDGTTNLFLRDLLHKAFVEVDEEGTRAGAATASHAGTSGMAPQFCADHPFLFLIRHNRTGSILFVGRVADPTRS
jgi:serpin B